MRINWLFLILMVTKMPLLYTLIEYGSYFHTIIKGLSITDVRTNLGIFGTPLPLSRTVHIWLSTPPLPPSPCPCRHKAGIIWNITTCEQLTLKGKKNLIILILDVYICVFLLDNFDNSIPKDGVDYKVNVTGRRDWPNKNASVPKSLSGKRI